jgi:hypothetical protein
VNQPLTNQQLNLDAIEAKAAELRERVDRKNPWPHDNESHWMAEGWKSGTRNALDKLHVEALVTEVRRRRAAMEQIRHLHKDSPMGPCPVCIDADAVAEGRDGLMPYPCPTGRLAGAQNCEPPSFRAASEPAGAPVAAEQPAGVPESRPDHERPSEAFLRAETVAARVQAIRDLAGPDGARDGAA